VSDYRDLKVFHKAHAMAKLANEIGCTIRSSHYASLRAQLIRAANSVPTNIVEGSGQASAKDFIRFLRYSINSVNELEYHCFAAHDYGLISAARWEQLTALIVEVRRMLNGLINYLKAHDAKLVVSGNG
jgi:four helix bundle protein